MKFNNIKIAVVLATFVLVALVALAPLSAQGFGAGQGGPGFGAHHPPMERALGPMGDHGRWWNEPRMIQKLNLTEDQRKAMDSILDQHKPELIDLRAKVEKAEVEMEPLMRADKPDEGSILAQIDKIADARKELEKSNARFLLALRSKLTVDQWKQLEAMRAQHMDHRGRMGEGREGRPMHGGPGMATPPPPQQPAAGSGGPMGGPQFDSPDAFYGDASEADLSPAEATAGIDQQIGDASVTRVLHLFDAQNAM